MNTRIFVRKKPGFRVESQSLEDELRQSLNLPADFRLVKYNIYDIFGADQEEISLLRQHVLAEAVTDEIAEPDGDCVLAYEYLPGQFDQRADSAMQCLMLLSGRKPAVIRSGTLLEMENISEKQKQAIASYVINPVESRIKDLSVLENDQDVQVEPVPVLEGFTGMDEPALEALHRQLGLAMSLEDLRFVQDHFRKDEHRDPTMTEIRVLDTYWSDHCRHTTFETVLEDVVFEKNCLQQRLQEAWDRYQALRQEVHGGRKPATLMDMASLAGKYMRKTGKLEDLEVSDEINACSIEITVDEDGVRSPWLLMFKNETHNHPTEIEPFGGAATCIGGAIRDPLSGRSYVYQAMRITGAGDINRPVSETMEHKLPQSRISKTAARGYSSYGNQIGLPTTFVEEIFDEGYTAKRMEVGAVIGAAPRSHVKREKPQPGDVVVLIGGATGRDGIGGATGSSKEHTDTSLEKCSSEVQKGNALTERKLQRLFRNPDVTRLIRKANDFGAGGVSVAIGELADGLVIDLDAVPVKYEGLDGTELAISESQERMAAVIPAESFDTFRELCRQENLDCVQAAVVTEEPRLVMNWRDETIVDLSRAFLDTNGVRQHQSVKVTASEYDSDPFRTTQECTLTEVLKRPDVACQIGLAEMFDASIGKSTVLMPFGGRKQLTPEEGSVQKLPTDGFTTTVSAMTFGFDPEVSKYSPYLGAAYSVTAALARQAALGMDPLSARLSNQEYFERLGHDPVKWGRPLEAMLGLIDAQIAFGTPSIGGKDSMSGTFNDIHVPPTVITFAVTTGQADKVRPSEFSQAGHDLYLLAHTPLADHSPDYEQLCRNFQALESVSSSVVAARSVNSGGIGAALAKMAFGNWIGASVEVPDPYGFGIGSLILETSEPLSDPRFVKIGQTNGDETLTINGQATGLQEAFDAWTSTYEGLYPRKARTGEGEPAADLCEGEKQYSRVQVEKPLVLIPVFPGQNCELDTTRRFERAGATVRQFVLNDRTPEALKNSVSQLAQEIRQAQILMIVGGFSAGDEPDGSGKFIANVLRNPEIAEAVDFMRRENDGLILGICNGFQALIKSGLLPGGLESGQEDKAPTLFRNDIDRHVSRVARTRVTSNRSPWLQDFRPGQVHSVAFSHGEGKFVADETWLRTLADNGQIATQYVDETGTPSMDGEYNINGSAWAVEGITSEDGRVLGKMGHSERWEEGLFINIDGDRNQDIFASGVRFFTHAPQSDVPEHDA
ncbi:phosphoribosylformylglycinamidine synthase [uncultured Faecalibaculum sp.]|uniref:phosphoribosylformylglycinamidine synthase n=1 Tax=uncultured Faecalibaculum sp. TaxID=1729681 RepID=UPI00272CF042|nr:phosphoribosylformylglycinamidine synthase [uncultured Faecalibaculum sp.]